MNRASVDKTLAYLPAKEKVEYFVFFPDEPFELRSLVSSTSSWVKAEEIIKAYDGRAMLVRRMANGKVLYEGDLYPQP